MRPSRRHPLPAADDRSSAADVPRRVAAPPDRSRRIFRGRDRRMKSPMAERDRDRLIEAMLPDVAFDGWSQAALRVAAKAVGMTVQEAQALFPRGAPDLVAGFSRWTDRRMLDWFETAPPEADSTSARIKRAVLLRFEVVAPWREG